jgi:exopolysaccharide biosynthesis polyprenyl glycosylphosphotransferase
VVEVLAERRAIDHRVAGVGRQAGLRPAWELRYMWQLIALDLFVACAADAVAYAIRFGHVPGKHSVYVLLSLLLPVGWIIVLGLNHAYDTRHLFAGNEEYQRVFRAGSALMATVAVVLYALDIGVARGYLVVAIPLALVCVGAERFVMRYGLHRSWEMGRRLRRVLAVGHAVDVGDLCNFLRRARYHGLEVVGACLPEPIGRWDERVPVPIYGSFDEIGRAASSAQADTVIVLSCPEINGPALRRLGWSIEDEKIDLIVASALMDVAGGRTTIRPVDGLPMLHVDHAVLRGPRRVVKDAFDRVGALLLIVAFSPALLVLAITIRLTSNGPAIFRQERIGRDGREFRITKFRTMYPGAERMLVRLESENEHDGLLFKMRADPRVTPIGRFLRRYSLDELPQLFNVLAGDMSLVGPRPPLRSEVERYPDDMRRRLVVKPGMTGLWQVSGRSDLPWDEVMRLDLRYVENWSLSFDLVILLRTLTAVMRSSGAY